MHNRGSIITLVITMLGALMIIIVGLTSYVLRQQKEGIDQEAEEVAFHLAESGIDYTLNALNTQAHTINSLVATYPDGTPLLQTVTEHDSSTTLGTYELTFSLPTDVATSESVVDVVSIGRQINLPARCQTIIARIRRSQDVSPPYQVVTWNHVSVCEGLPTYPTLVPSPLPSPPNPSSGPLSCGDTATYSGGQGDQTLTVNVGSGQGEVTMNFDAYCNPDRFRILFDGAEVANTGFRGGSGRNGIPCLQSQVDAYNDRLASIGQPPMIEPGTGSISFSKTSATEVAHVNVYGPFENTEWEFTMQCPQPASSATPSIPPLACPANNVTWVHHTITSGSPGDILARSMETEDIDNDGDMDIISGDDNTHTTVMYNESTSSSLTWDIQQDTALLGPISLTITDVDSDGNKDIVGYEQPTGSTGPYEYVWLKNQGVFPTGWTRQVITSVPSGEYVGRSTAGDLNGDGTPEVIRGGSRGALPRKVFWYTYNASNTPPWSEQETNLLSNTDIPQHSLAQDINGDSFVDLLFSPQNAGAPLFWLQNSGGTTPSWTQHTIIASTPTGPGTYSMATSDFDGDGSVDVAANNTIYRNISGDGLTWTPFTFHLTTRCNASMRSYDVDIDGDQDIVCPLYMGSGAGNDRILWYENTNSFSTAWPIHTITDVTSTPGDPFAIAIADFDRDGDTDVASSTHGRISWHERRCDL